MNEKPTLFSDAMVRAILDGSKTQTRRVVKPQPVYRDVAGVFAAWVFKKRHDSGYWLYPNAKEIVLAECPYGAAGDRLWVREAWAQPAAADPGPTVYRADYPACVPPEYENVPPASAIKWKPSIHMPRPLSRITLEVTDVRVEQLQHCSEDDARQEGCPEDATWAIEWYRGLWDSLNEKRGFGWRANPWVWVVSFKRVAE